MNKVRSPCPSAYDGARGADGRAGGREGGRRGRKIVNRMLKLRVAPGQTLQK